MVQTPCLKEQNPSMVKPAFPMDTSSSLRSALLKQNETNTNTTD